MVARKDTWGVRPLLLDALYVGGLAVAIPYLCLRGRSTQLWEHIRRRSRGVPRREGKRPCLWIHGVSVGEVFSTRRLVERLAAEFPAWEPVISTTTRAGLEAARKAFPQLQVFSYPFDLSPLVRKAFDRINPQLIVIAEHELWPNFLDLAGVRGVPVVLINGRLSERSQRGYRMLSWFISWPPPSIVRVCAEDETSADGFRRLGVDADRIRVTGNLKFDNVERLNGARRSIPREGDWVLVGASTHPGEEEALLDSFEALHRSDPRIRMVLAPRRVERVRELEKLVRRRGLRSYLWSEHGARNGNGLGVAAADEGGRSPGDVYLVDTVGELSRISATANAVFVGGSLVPFGGHNVIEPASHGCPVIIGPHYQNFRQVVSAFVEHDAVLIAGDRDDLTQKLRDLKANAEFAEGMGQRAIETIAHHTGATERTLEVLRPLLHEVAAREIVSVEG